MMYELKLGYPITGLDRHLGLYLWYSFLLEDDLTPGP
jgi:hypothetical protein